LVAFDPLQWIAVLATNFGLGEQSLSLFSYGRPLGAAHPAARSKSRRKELPNEQKHENGAEGDHDELHDPASLWSILIRAV
jgi:hypothetical protein